MITNQQIPARQREIISNQLDKFKDRTEPVDVDRIPNTNEIPGEGTPKWLKIKDVICVFVDMKNSTQLSASRHAQTTAKTYTLFTGTAVRLFKSFGASYIDIKGDGVFALFNADEVNKAIVSAVTFKTFVQEEFAIKISNKTHIDTGVRIGIDQSTLLVSRVGLKRHASRGDIHNEVWAGKAVNVASKLSGLSNSDEIHVSDYFFNKLKSDKIIYSCACSGMIKLWQEVDVSGNEKFAFDTAHVLKSVWCKTHGSEYIESLLKDDE